MALSTAATHLEAAPLLVSGGDAATPELTEPAAEQIETLTLTKRKSFLANRTFSERVDSDVLNRILQTELVDGEEESREAKWMRSKYFCAEREHLVKLQRKLKDGVLHVKHKKGKISFGRVVPAGYLAAIGLRAELRWLLYPGYVDFDMVNAHPTIISQLCKAFSIPCVNLQDYVDHREHHLQALTEILTMEDAKTARDLAKFCFIRVMFGGSPSTWLCENKSALKPGATLPPFVFELSTEIRAISKAIQAENTELVRVVKEKRANDGKTTNFNGSFLSYFAQEWECRILEHVIVFAASKGYLGDNNSACLMYDGVQLLEENIQRQGITADAVCRQFESVVRRKTGLRVPWAQKPMDKSLLGELEAAEAQIKRQIEEFEFDETKTQQFDSTYMNELECYILKKRYFELFACKVMTPEVSYVFEQTIVEDNGTKEFTTAQYSVHMIRDMLSHCPSGEVDGRNQSIPFTKRWIYDPEIRVYNRVVNEPYAGVYKPVCSGENTYNLFKGYDSRTETPHGYDRSTDDGQKKYLEVRLAYLKPFLDLVKELCGGNENHRDFILRNFAIKYQYPASKHPFIIVFIGPQGTGKSLFLDAIGRLFGEEHYYATDNPEDLFGKHAEGFVGKLVVQLSECEGRDMRQHQSKMKARSTDVYLTCNAKCRRPIRVKNYALLVVVSNKPNPIKIDVTSGDRRFIVMKGTEAYLENRGVGRKGKSGAFWKQLAAHLEKPLFMRFLSDYFNEMKLDDIDWSRERKQHLTPAYYAMALQSVPIEATFLEDIMSKLKMKVQEEAQNEEMRRQWTHKMHKVYLNLGYDEGENATLFEFKLGNDGAGYCVQVERRRLFAQFKLWVKLMNFKHCQTAKRFYSRLKELEIPGFQENIKSMGYNANRFRPDDILSHLIAKRWSESDAPQDEESSMSEVDDEDLSQFDMSAYDSASSSVSDDSVDSAYDGEEGTANERPAKKQRTN